MSTFTAEITLEEGQALYQAAMQQAATNLAAKGVAPPLAPMMTGPGNSTVPYRGELPPDLTQLTDNMLGTYMGLMTEWGNYIAYQLAEADVNLTKAKANIGLVEAKLRLVYQRDEEKKKRSNPERDDYVGSDRRYIEAEQEVLYWQAMYTFLRTINNNAENSYAAISRRVTQRGQEVDRMNRTGGVTGGSNVPQGPMFGGWRR